MGAVRLFFSPWLHFLSHVFACCLCLSNSVISSLSNVLFVPCQTYILISNFLYLFYSYTPASYLCFALFSSLLSLLRARATLFLHDRVSCPIIFSMHRTEQEQANKAGDRQNRPGWADQRTGSGTGTGQDIDLAFLDIWVGICPLPFSCLGPICPSPHTFPHICLCPHLPLCQPSSQPASHPASDSISSPHSLSLSLSSFPPLSLPLCLSLPHTTTTSPSLLLPVSTLWCLPCCLVWHAGG